jgi:predicted DNA-binding protein (UPF0251 family)
VASCLHGVARRVSARAKVEAARRRSFERRGARMSPRWIESAKPPESWPELHEQVDRLPEKFRSPIVLIDLEGCTQQQAAERLRWPLGTVQSRLARGRDRLRARLVRRGQAPSAGLLVGPSVESPMPAVLLDSTAQAAMAFAAGSATSEVVPPAAATLAKGVLKTIDLSITEARHEGGRMLGICTWDGDRLKWCTTTPQGGERPTEFTCEPGSGHLLVGLKKE